jgi:acetyl esterase/lipase
MKEDSEAVRGSRSWRPRGLTGWIATIVAGLIVLVLGLTLYYMLRPVGFGGLGTFGALGFFFSTTFILLAPVTAGLWYIARRRGALLPGALFAVATLLTLVISLWPTIALMRAAADLEMPVSLVLALKPEFNLGQSENSVVYATTPDGTALSLDVWPATRPGGAPPGPALVHVHGGAWTQGGRGEAAHWNREMARRGFQVFDVEYRLAPTATWIQEVGDVKCALGWIVAHAARYNIDPDRISILGNSAGGNLAMLAANSAGNPALPPSCDVPAVRIRSVVNFYGPADLADLYRNTGSPIGVRPAMRTYIGGTPEEFPARYAMLSPITHVTRSAPPTLTLLGTSDRLVPSAQIELFHSALNRAGVANKLVLLPASDHAFDGYWNALSTQIARKVVFDFLDESG